MKMMNIRWKLVLVLFLTLQLLTKTDSESSDVNLEGYTSFIQVNFSISNITIEKTKEGIKFVMGFSSADETEILSRVHTEHLVLFFLFYYSIVQDNLILTNVVIEAAHRSQKKKPINYFRDLLESKFDFNRTHVHKFIKTVAGGKSKGVNEIPLHLKELVLHLDNKYKVFQDACLSGDVELVKWYLESGFQMKDIPLKLLEDSFNSGHIGIVEAFLKFNYFNVRKSAQSSFINKRTVRGQYFNKLTFLHIAASAGLQESVDFLLQQGAEVNVIDASGQTPLYRAVQYNRLSIIRSLISAKADLKMQYGKSGDTILHVAVFYKQLDAVKTLIELGIRVTTLNKRGETALHTAAKVFSEDIISYLRETKADMNSKDFSGNTPLHAASLAGNHASVRLLLNLGAKVTEKNYLNQTPLFKAVESSHIGLMKDFVNIAPSLISDVSSIGDTVMHIAADIGNVEVIKALISMGASPNQKNSKDQVPLYRAALNGNTDAVSLLQDKTDMNLISSGNSMLHEAVFDGSEEAARILLAYGINVDILGLWDNTPLHLAAGFGHANLVTVLLENKANPNAKNKNDMTPLHRAAIGGHLNVVQLLVNNNKIRINTNAKDSSGKTALDLAREKNHIPVIQYLSQQSF